MNIKIAFENYKKAANELVKEILPNKSEETTHEQVICCLIIEKTGETVGSLLHIAGYKV